MTSSEGTVIVNLNNQKMEYTISKNLGQDYLAASFSGSMGIVSQGIGGKVAIVVDILDGIVTGVFDSHLNEDKNFSHIVGTAASAFLLGEAGARAGLIIGGLPGAVLGALVGGVAGALFGDDIDYNVTALIHNLAIDFNEFKYSDVTTVYDVTANKIIIEDIANNDPNFCKDIFPQYLNYRQIVDIKSGLTLAESVRYDNTTNEITISNATSDNQNFYLNETLKNNDIDKATINDIVYIKQDLTNQTSLQIRNLLNDINSVNILLSNVLIKTDENRITFNTPSEILVNQTANLNNNNQNHTLIGTNSDDILIEYNGGDATFEAAEQLDLNSQSASNNQGIENLKDIMIRYIKEFESNKEEKLENINNLFTQINSLDTTQDKLTLLSSTDLSSSFENNYCKQFISQYQDKVISNEGNSLSSTDIFSIQINPNFNLDSFNKQEEYKPSFSESFFNNNNNSNSSIQAMG